MAAATLSKCRTILQIIYEHTLYSIYICMKTSMSGIIYFRDVLWVKVRLLMLDLLSN